MMAMFILVLDKVNEATRSTAISGISDRSALKLLHTRRAGALLTTRERAGDIRTTTLNVNQANVSSFSRARLPEINFTFKCHRRTFSFVD